ncbi:3-hydroxyacyl-CoA dehydrogenase family protein [Roseovarius sp. PS-C2]|uniref:3-hydroxyacyl-CoA dehydrogenase family protein n=1 Tax=Roseovarius sp. PS-C2 TaxID=2820814 RepID=UPI001C0C95EC|nr:3-hydroxyacyl-CoA dehydrogenase family protein [Roseovarius sp. PS-C2]MBU3259878.1 3-hydroxyacyl-CoA dehydrogenase family protein [Roseovarius sp. PS-C2]
MTKEIRTLGIVGAGTMGAGIMINAVTSGLKVVLVDRKPDILEAAKAKLASYLSRQVQKGRIEADTVEAMKARLSLSDEMSALAGADVVIEAVFENLDLKRTIFDTIEKVVPDDTLLASNTSCLRISDIAQVLKNPARFCGTHYFSPAEINPVVELIQGADTAPETLESAAAFLKLIGKEVIPCKDQNGFALNRFFCPYTNEAVRLLDEGVATAAQIDAVAKDAFGLALGPFAVMNIIGTATNLNAVRNLAALGPFYEPAASLEAHGKDNQPWELDPSPEPPGVAAQDQISARLTQAILLPVSELLAEGTATLEAIDHGARLAFRFGVLPGELMAKQGV